MQKNREKTRSFLIDARRKKGYKQFEVAQAVGLSPGAYSNIELGIRNPSVKLAKKIGEFLEFEWTRFFE